eukprot:333505-Chlamydomonas_euryale.AAC.1
MPSFPSAVATLHGAPPANGVQLCTSSLARPCWSAIRSAGMQEKGWGHVSVGTPGPAGSAVRSAQHEWAQGRGGWRGSGWGHASVGKPGPAGHCMHEGWSVGWGERERGIQICARCL